MKLHCRKKRPGGMERDMEYDVLIIGGVTGVPLPASWG